MTPAELMKAILQAPVDLLWNGGIGTYVKGEDETHADVGDKANDAIRVNGSELRARCVGEGGNLGLTQAGRIEYVLYGGDAGGASEEGGRINTDFIDNSAGVDTSDHEVNIKILLDRVVKDGDLTAKQRNSAARRDDRRGRRAGAARQLRAEPRASPTPSRTPRRCCTCTRTSCAGSSRPAPSTARSRGCRPGGRYAAGSTAAAGSPRPSWRC